MFPLAAADKLTPVVGNLALELITPLLARREFDLVSELAVPLSFHVMSHLLGVPREHHALLQEMSKPITSMFGPLANREVAHDAREQVKRVNSYLQEHIEDFIAKSPIARALQQGVENEAIDSRDFFPTLFFLMIAGYETSAGLIANVMQEILRQPSIQQELWRNPSRALDAAYEGSRLMPSVHVVTRLANEPVELTDTIHLERNERLLLFVPSANRDPAQFPDPNHFDLDRRAGPGLTFGHGPHTCLGMHIAIAEVAEVIRLFASMTTALHVTEPSPQRWQGDGFIKSCQSLLVRPIAK